MPADVTQMTATSEDADAAQSMKNADVLQDTSFLRIIHDGKPATEFPVQRWGGHTLPPPGWYCSILGKTIGHAVEKPPWFNNEKCEAVKSGVQEESTCGLFCVNHVLAQLRKPVRHPRTRPAAAPLAKGIRSTWICVD